MHVVEGKEQMQTQLREWSDRLLACLPADHCDRLSPEALHQKLASHKPGRWQVIELTPKLALETFPLDSWGNIESETVIPASFGYCNGTTDQAGILYDGTVVPCCKDYDGKIPLGNLNLRQVGSIAYFKIYNPIMKRLNPGWGEV